MDIKKESLELHKKLNGKIETTLKEDIKDMKDLSLVYSPGVSEPCMEIKENHHLVYDYTIKANTIAVITDGSAVLGLGDIGSYASIPVMEGKAALLKKFANVNAFPICINSHDPEEIINVARLIAPVFGGINLEDICAPKCFYIERKLQEELDIPVFHDDQHGTAIITLAGLKNALKVVGKKITDIKVTINGIGSAGVAIMKLLSLAGVKNFSACDKNGQIFSGKIVDNEKFEELIQKRKETNYSEGTLEEAIVDSDVFIGVSVAGALTTHMIKKMSKDPIIFAMANPNPEITPEEAKKAGARIICTGRSDYPNQINNVLAFPGIFKGALDVRAKKITEEMKLAAVDALSSLISDEDLNDDYIIPMPFDERVVERVSEYVSRAYKE